MKITLKMTADVRTKCGMITVSQRDTASRVTLWRPCRPHMEIPAAEAVRLGQYLMSSRASRTESSGCGVGIGWESTSENVRILDGAGDVWCEIDHREAPPLGRILYGLGKDAEKRSGEWVLTKRPVISGYMERIR